MNEIVISGLCDELILLIMSFLQPLHQKRILSKSRLYKYKLGYTVYLFNYRTNLSYDHTWFMELSFDIVIFDIDKIKQIISTSIECNSDNDYLKYCTRLGDKIKYGTGIINSCNVMEISPKSILDFYNYFQYTIKLSTCSKEELYEYFKEGSNLSDSMHNKYQLISQGKKLDEYRDREEVCQYFIECIENHQIQYDTDYHYTDKLFLYNSDIDDEDEDEDEDDDETNVYYGHDPITDSELIYYRKYEL